MKLLSTLRGALSTLCLMALCVVFSSSAFAADPGFSLASGASYNANEIARGAHVILYPTNGNFTGITGGGGVVNPYATSAYGIRLKQTKDGETFFATLTYVSATQINAILAYTEQNSIIPNSLMTFQLEKSDGMGGWVAERGSQNINVPGVNPRSFVIYNGSDPFLSAGLWVCDNSTCTGSASFVKDLLDGNPNPLSISGNPTFVAVYLTGTRVGVSGNTVHISGSANGSILGSATEVYPGVEQINWLPSGLSAGTYTVRVVNASTGSGVGNDAKITFQ